MKKAVLIIGSILAATGIAIYAFKKYWADPAVEVRSVDWNTMMAQLTVGGQPMILKDDGTVIPIGRSGRVISFSNDKARIILTVPNSGGAVIYDTYATKPV